MGVCIGYYDRILGRFWWRDEWNSAHHFDYNHWWTSFYDSMDNDRAQTHGHSPSRTTWKSHDSMPGRGNLPLCRIGFGSTISLNFLIAHTKP